MLDERRNRKSDTGRIATSGCGAVGSDSAIAPLAVVSLLGRPEILAAGSRRPNLLKKAWCLLAALAFAPRHTLPRSSITAFLWPDDEAKRANNSLRQLLIKTRRAFGPAEAGLLVSASHVQLDPRRLDVDVVHLARCEGSQSMDCLNTLVRRYQGQLLDGIELAEPSLDDWLQARRVRLCDMFLSAAATLLSSAGGSISPGLVDLADRVIAIDPYNTAACRYLLIAKAGWGDRAGALAAFARHADRLRRELGIPPDPDVTEVAQRIRGEMMLAGGDPGTDFERRLNERNALAGASAPALDMPTVLVLYPPDARMGGASDGLPYWVMDDIAFGLTRFRTLAVVAPHTARQISAHRSHLDLAVRALGVRFVLESRMEPAENPDRLRLRLAEAASGNVLWLDQVDLPSSRRRFDYPALLRPIIAHVASSIEWNVALGRQEALPEAYLSWLQGSALLSRLDIPSIRFAAKQFRRSLDASPGFSPALSGLARTQTLQWMLRSQSGAALLKEALALADQAVASDSADGRGYRERGLALLHLGDHDAALEAFREAKFRNPHHADTLADYADCLGFAGDPEAGLRVIRNAIELNRLCPDYYLWTLGGIQFQLKEYDRAIETVRKLSDARIALRLLAASHAMLDQMDEARRNASDLLRAVPNFNVKSWLTHVPNRRAEDHEHYASALLAAGLPWE